MGRSTRSREAVGCIIGSAARLKTMPRVSICARDGEGGGRSANCTVSALPNAGVGEQLRHLADPAGDRSYTKAESLPDRVSAGNTGGLVNPETWTIRARSISESMPSLAMMWPR